MLRGRMEQDSRHGATASTRGHPADEPESCEFGLLAFDGPPVAALCRCADLVPLIMRRDMVSLAEAAGIVVDTLADFEGLELFELRPGGYACRWVIPDKRPEIDRTELFRPIPFFGGPDCEPWWASEPIRPVPQPRSMQDEMEELDIHWQEMAERYGRLDGRPGKRPYRWSFLAVRRADAVVLGLVPEASRPAAVLQLAQAEEEPVTETQKPASIPAERQPVKWSEEAKQAMRDARAAGESDASIAKRHDISRQRLAELIGSKTACRLQAAAAKSKRHA